MSVGEGPRVEPSAPERGGLIATLGIAQSADFDLAADLAIPAGTTAALLGPNGAGKSTAVAAIAGLRALERGRIVLDGRVLDDPAAGLFVPAPDRRIGVVFQDQLLFDHMSVQDNVAFGLRARGLSRAAATEQSRDWIEHVGLQGLHDRRPRELSGGQAQRVALARALAPDPDLLLLDEPLSALDVTTRASLRRTLAQHLEGFAGPRLVITHEPTEAFLLADDVHVLEGGRITQVGTPDDIRLRPKTPYAADLAGANLLTGQVNDGMVEVTGGGALHVADHAATGAVLVAISPTAVTVHRQRPEGSQRNTWATTLERVEHLGDRVRLRTRSPVPLTIEVTREATDELGLVVDAEVWVAVKATEIGLQSEQPV